MASPDVRDDSAGTLLQDTQNAPSITGKISVPSFYNGDDIIHQSATGELVSGLSEVARCSGLSLGYRPSRCLTPKKARDLIRGTMRERSSIL